MTKGRSDPRTGNARRLRRDTTFEERKLWAVLKGLDLPHGHFRRQAPIGAHFADFAHHGLRLVIELDGGQHGHEAHVLRDRTRTAHLEAAGYRVLRFWNTDVRDDVSGVLETIVAALAAKPPTPNTSPPQAGGGEIARDREAEFGNAPC